MIKITKTNWRPFIELTPVSGEEDSKDILYLDVTKRPIIIQSKEGTIIHVDDVDLVVKESAKDIFKAVDKLIAEEAEHKRQEAKRYAEETLARVAATEKALKGEA